MKGRLRRLLDEAEVGGVGQSQHEIGRCNEAGRSNQASDDWMLIESSGRIVYQGSRIIIVF